MGLIMQGHGSNVEVDMSGWHMKFLVNKLQGRQYISQILVITSEVMCSA